LKIKRVIREQGRREKERKRGRFFISTKKASQLGKSGAWIIFKPDQVWKIKIHVVGIMAKVVDFIFCACLNCVHDKIQITTKGEGREW